MPAKLLVHLADRATTQTRSYSLSLSRNRIDSILYTASKISQNSQTPKSLRKSKPSTIIACAVILGLIHISQAKPSTDDEIQNQASNTQEIKRSKNKSKEITQDKEPNNKAKQSLCGGKHSLSACFAGFEVGVVLGKADIYGNIYHITSPTPNKINHKGGIGGGGVGNLILGYQWYFIEKMGIGLKAHLGYGGIIPYFTYAKADNSVNPSFSSSMEAYPFNAFNWGIQANYLLNFTKVFGLSLGAGFEMSYFENGEIYERYEELEKNLTAHIKK